MEELSIPEKTVLSQIIDESPILDYELKRLDCGEYQAELVYEIPDEDKEKVFKELWPFGDCPAMDEVFFDIHEGEPFIVKDYQVIRSRNRNFICSPYYAHSGGMVVDFVRDIENIMDVKTIRK